MDKQADQPMDKNMPMTFLINVPGVIHTYTAASSNRQALAQAIYNAFKNRDEFNWTAADGSPKLYKGEVGMQQLIADLLQDPRLEEFVQQLPGQPSTPLEVQLPLAAPEPDPNSALTNPLQPATPGSQPPAAPQPAGLPNVTQSLDFDQIVESHIKIATKENLKSLISQASLAYKLDDDQLDALTNALTAAVEGQISPTKNRAITANPPQFGGGLPDRNPVKMVREPHRKQYRWLSEKPEIEAPRHSVDQNTQLKPSPTNVDSTRPRTAKLVRARIGGQCELCGAPALHEGEPIGEECGGCGAWVCQDQCTDFQAMRVFQTESPMCKACAAAGMARMNSLRVRAQPYTCTGCGGPLDECDVCGGLACPKCTEVHFENHDEGFDAVSPGEQSPQGPEAAKSRYQNFVLDYFGADGLPKNQASKVSEAKGRGYISEQCEHCGLTKSDCAGCGRQLCPECEEHVESDPNTPLDVFCGESCKQKDMGKYTPCGPVQVGGPIGSCSKELGGRLCPYCTLQSKTAKKSAKPTECPKCGDQDIRTIPSPEAEPKSTKYMCASCDWSKTAAGLQPYEGKPVDAVEPEEFYTNDQPNECGHCLVRTVLEDQLDDVRTLERCPSCQRLMVFGQDMDEDRDDPENGPGSDPLLEDGPPRLGSLKRTAMDQDLIALVHEIYRDHQNAGWIAPLEEIHEEVSEWFMNTWGAAADSMWLSQVIEQHYHGGCKDQALPLPEPDGQSDPDPEGWNPEASLRRSAGVIFTLAKGVNFEDIEEPQSLGNGGSGYDVTDNGRLEVYVPNEMVAEFERLNSGKVIRKTAFVRSAGACPKCGDPMSSESSGEQGDEVTRRCTGCGYSTTARHSGWLKSAGGSELCECGHTGNGRGSQHQSEGYGGRLIQNGQGLGPCAMCDECTRFKSVGPIPPGAVMGDGEFMPDTSVMDSQLDGASYTCTKCTNHVAQPGDLCTECWKDLHRPGPDSPQGDQPGTQLNERGDRVCSCGGYNGTHEASCWHRRSLEGLKDFVGRQTPEKSQQQHDEIERFKQDLHGTPTEDEPQNIFCGHGNCVKSYMPDGSVKSNPCQQCGKQAWLRTADDMGSPKRKKPSKALEPSLPGVEPEIVDSAPAGAGPGGRGPAKRKVKPQVENDELAKMQSMVDSGSCWRMEGSLGRHVMSLIEAGQIALGPSGMKDYWGNYIPSRYEVKPGTKGSVDFVRANGGRVPVEDREPGESYTNRYTCQFCGQAISDQHEVSGFEGGADWATLDGDFGCDSATHDIDPGCDCGMEENDNTCIGRGGSHKPDGGYFDGVLGSANPEGMRRLQKLLSTPSVLEKGQLGRNCKACTGPLILGEGHVCTGCAPFWPKKASAFACKKCGTQFDLNPGGRWAMTNTCPKCGAEYNWNGQRLVSKTYDPDGCNCGHPDCGAC